MSFYWKSSSAKQQEMFCWLRIENEEEGAGEIE